MQQQSGPIESVREGMSVVDVAGNDIGSVDMIKMSDPEAETTAGQIPDDPGEPTETPGPVGIPAATPGGVTGSTGVPSVPVGVFAGSTETAEPDLPPSLAERLLREGYLKINRKGLFKKDAYVAADDIDAVDGDVVRLRIAQDSLLNEQ